MIKKLWDRMFTREVLTYLLFGVLTTVVNYVVFWLTLRLGGEELVLVANALAFVASVIFAYVTNKIFVFQSKSWTWNVLKKEVATFVGCQASVLWAGRAGPVALYPCVEGRAVGAVRHQRHLGCQGRLVVSRRDPQLCHQ